ncbi:MAG TPA: CHASE3 domain-containing protein [Pirellulales bacterium]|jgi:methyl-accepting chemotaxis protein|nr:CHASE3 domain-containing protein [Pirellulales bacterium]HEX4130292.1 CHASE3 domain-containing protein [Pirellulales bacterium]
MKFTVGVRILLGFGLALLILAIVGGVSYRSTISLIDNAEWVAHSHRVLESLENVIAQVTNAETGQRGFLLTGMERYLEPYHVATEGLDAKMADLRRMTSDNPDQQHRLDLLAPLIAGKFAELQQTISLRKEKSPEAALEVVLTDRGKQLMDGIRKIVAEMQNEENKLLKLRADESKSSAQATTSTILFGSLAAFVLVGVSSVLIQRSITMPLGRFVEFVDRVGKGDLTQQATITSRDEVGRLGEGINEMVVGLKGMSGQIMSVSERMNAAAAEILASTQQQATGTKEQAATIQQITATMEEVRQSGVQISERAKQVTATAEATATITVTGLSTVQEANHTMEAIRQQVEEVAENVVSLSEKTQAVGEIIATVNDIAERSNLLALNAAIEAAAAGDQGSRFSVVANEIKNLADQAKESTVQVRTILGDIQKRINSSVMLTEEAVKRTETGKQQADVTEDTIRRMADTTQESVQAFQQIISATCQQQIGFEQVTQGMQDIGQAASQTAAGTVQLEKAVASLNAQSHQLREAVGRYQI